MTEDKVISATLIGQGDLKVGLHKVEVGISQMHDVTILESMEGADWTFTTKKITTIGQTKCDKVYLCEAYVQFHVPADWLDKAIEEHQDRRINNGM